MSSNIALLGGKGSGLEWLLVNQDIGKDQDLMFKVPEFKIIDTTYYEGFKEAGNMLTPRLIDYCNQLTEQFKGRKIVVRSSAVVSEDSDKHSGAGLYETVFLEHNWAVEDVIDAVLQVYASVNSPKALAYRQENGLGEESMAVVVQELLKKGHLYTNGVMYSRLQGNGKIIPVWWSLINGAVVEKIDGAIVNTMYFVDKGSEAGPSPVDRFKRQFVSDAYALDKDFLGNWRANDYINPERNVVHQKLIPLISLIKERYGKDFDAEFCFNMATDEIYLVQIRPLTNIQDVDVKFPDKEPIFTGNFCVGAGEYVGPLLTPKMVRKLVMDRFIGRDNFPDDYAFAIQQLNRSTVHKYFAGNMLYDQVDFDRLTPKKRALILNDNDPGTHAMTLANERGILCMGAKPRLVDEHRTNYQELTPVLFIALDDVKYVHVVQDGVRSHVYKATEEEYLTFRSQQLNS